MEWALLIVFLGLLFDYTNGFHDAANVVSTVIATRALAPLTAIVLAGVLNTLGATQVSGVAQTIAEGLVDPKMITQGMIIAGLVGAIIWNFGSWFFGLPSSSSYALIGGLIGSVWHGGGLQFVYWGQLLHKVVIPMVLSPLVGFLLAFLLMRILVFIGKTKDNPKLYKHLQIGSASIVALAHGMNDAQKSMGIITLGLFSAGLIGSIHIPIWVILACALVMGLGTAFGGMRIIHTVSYKITHIAPIQGFAAEMSASCVILAASFLGMPLSSTQMIVGSVTGVGAAKGKGRIKWEVGRNIILTWLLTLPGSALLSALINKLFSMF